MKVLAGGTLGVTVMGSVVGLAAAGLLSATEAATAPARPSAVAMAEIPPSLLPVYQAAAGACDGLAWQIAAAIGAIESNHGGGRLDAATGQVSPPIMGPALDGRPGVAAIADPSSPDGWAHALGPMQFLPTTWSRWATVAPGRPHGARPDPHNAWDAIHAANRKLCAGRPEMGDLRAAILAYNRSESYYAKVWSRALAYGMAPDGSTGAVAGGEPVFDPGPGRTFPGDPAAVVRAALAQLGVPYVWGGATPGVALDCSGLVLIAYRAAGVTVPRTTTELVTYGVTVSPTDLGPGDLVFTRGGRPTRDLGHVGIYAGDGLYVVAPRTGELVTLRPVPSGSIQLVRRILQAR
ncbi:MAG: C40 family peptidase [Actinobacteria bacterium]|nr:C40 family peptidase [Actinomycetota bacterium]